MLVKLRLLELINDLEENQLSENEEGILEIIKELVKYREYDTSTALHDLKVDLDYFRLKLKEIEK